MAKKLPTGFVDIPAPITQSNLKAEAERIAKEAAEKEAKEEAERIAKEAAEKAAKEQAELEKAEKLTKPASYTIPVYLKEWLQNHADQMTADKSVEGRWTASKLVTQLIKEFKDRTEVE